MMKIKHSFYKSRKDIPPFTNSFRSSPQLPCHQRLSSGYKVSREITLANRNDLHQPKAASGGHPFSSPAGLTVNLFAADNS